MPLHPIRVGPVALGTSNATLYLARHTERLVWIQVTNTTGSVKTVTLAVVPAGETLGTIHHVMSAAQIALNDLVLLSVQIPMMPGDTIQGSASAAGLNFRAMVEIEP